ncbi:MAG: alpha/beta fold hydrolase, partial [Fimbriimonadales bacterium]
ACWEAHRSSQEARMRATQPLSDGITAFFSNRLPVLARQLTITCARLRSAEEPSAAMLYAGSIGTRFQRLADTQAYERDAKLRTIQIFNYYEAVAPEKPLALTLRVFGNKQVSAQTLAEWRPDQQAVSLPALPEGDYRVRFTLSDGGNSLRTWEQPLSLVSRLTERLEALEQALEAHPDADPIERATVKMTHEVLQACLAGTSPETNYPLLKQLRFAETLVEGWKRNARGWQAQTGDYWMATSYASGTYYFRLYLPRQFQAGKPIPLVVALHGAGGNEHLFFEGYGLGQVLKEAEKYGWAVIAPRTSTSLNHVWGAMEAAQKLIPVDPERVYLMGHSMGGAQSFAVLAQRPERFRAVAIFAGAGQPTNLPKDLPIFMTVGAQELTFLMNNIQTAYRRLQAMELQRLEYREYPACEHLMIVREALPDACAFLASAPPRTKSEAEASK